MKMIMDQNGQQGSKMVTHIFKYSNFVYSRTTIYINFLVLYGQFGPNCGQVTIGPF